MPAHSARVPGDFDVIALWEALDAQRQSRDMTWGQVSKTIGWMSKSTMDRMRERGTATCNHVLPMIQWVGRTPESFTVDPDGAVHEPLPDPEGRWRWWWHHHDLAAAVEAKRRELGLDWPGAASAMGIAGAADAVKGIDRLRYGPPIGLAMIAARWVQRSAASFLTETPPALTGPSG